MKRFRRGRLAAGATAPDEGEAHDELAVTVGFRVEHIRSGRVSTPVEFIQAVDEWVMLVEGSAVMEVADRRIELAAGEWALLPANLPHRLLRVEPGTSWVAVYGLLPGAQPYSDESGDSSSSSR